MIKCLSVFLILAATPFFACAQSNKEADTNRVNSLLHAISKIEMVGGNTDSVESLSKEALSLSERLDYVSGRQRSLSALADYYFLKGKLGLALGYLLKNEESAIASGDSVMLFNILRSEAGIYNRIGDINMLRNTIMRRQYILDNNGIKNLKDSSYQVLSQYNNLAHYYLTKQVNMPDSAAWYYRKMMQHGLNTQRANLWGQLSNGGLGNYYLSKNQFDSAVWYLKIGIAMAAEGKRIDNQYGYMASLARAFHLSGQTDSAFKYAYYLQNNASKLGYNSILATSSSTLAKLFTAQKQYDSAVKYMALESSYKDSVTGVEALNNIQFISNDFQMKTLERQREKEQAVNEYKTRVKNYAYAGGVLLLLMVIAAMYRVNKQRTRSKKTIESAYLNLKATQAQLIQSEKMASLGELTAGIAHEIQNPLNFVNNFSEVSNELVDEMKEELAQGNYAEAAAIANDVKQNLEKINNHGKRADAIVKGMLQHSRSSSGQKESSDINALCDEYLRLSYHGLRAKDKSFNASFSTEFDPSIGNINIVPQEIGRVIMNLLTNAFYAVNEKAIATPAADTGNGIYQPTVSIGTKKTKDRIEIQVSDNGNGIPKDIADKIFQPFFTTKPTGKGTGLGLSLSYDIVKAHGGEITVAAEDGRGSTFTITLPNIAS